MSPTIRAPLGPDLKTVKNETTVNSDGGVNAR